MPLDGTYEMSLVEEIAQYMLQAEAFTLSDLEHRYRPEGLLDSRWRTTWWQAIEFCLRNHGVVFDPDSTRCGRYIRATADRAIKRAVRFHRYAVRKNDRAFLTAQIAQQLPGADQAQFQRIERRIGQDLTLSKVAQRRASKKQPPGI